MSKTQTNSNASASRVVDPAYMALIGRIGAFTTHSRYDRRETTAKARQTFLARFETEVDPDGTLPEDERRRRAEAARRAYFARLALRSVQVRKARKTAGGASAQTPGGTP